MKLAFKNGFTSVMLRVKIMDSTSTTGGGKTGLLFSSTGLIISTIADNEATPTVYTAAGSTIETITTLGTFAAPTATKCRFKEVDATNHPGLCEIQVADARWAVSNARSVIITVSGATGAAQVDAEIQLIPVPSNVTQLLDTAWLAPAVPGTPDVNAKLVAGVAPPGNFGVLSISGLGKINGVVLVDSMTDKLGFRLSAAGVDDVFDEVASGHGTPGTTGKALIDASTGAGGASQASVDAIATTIGVAGAGLTAADDAVISAIAALNNLSQANVRTAVGLATANLDDQLSAIAGFIDTEIGTLITSVGAIGSFTAADRTKLERIDTDYTTARAVKIDNADVTTSSRMATFSYTAPDNAGIAAILDDTGNSGVVVVLSAANCNRVADHVRRRTQANVEVSTDGDALSVGSEYGFIQQAQESSVSGTTLTINKTDATLLGTKTLTVSAGASPVTGVA